MNYLGHFVFNHDVCGLAPEPYFVMGVVLPDLWPRFSRVRRISWRTVRTACPLGPIDAKLRAGLLNHVHADRKFHALPCFVRWLRALRAQAADDQRHSTVVDFLAHLAIEMALDHHLVRRDPQLPDRLYDVLAGCDATAVERAAGVVAGVDARGLSDEVHAFVGRRFLRRFGCRETLRSVVGRVLQCIRPARGPAATGRPVRGRAATGRPVRSPAATRIRIPPAARLVDELLDHAVALVEPDEVCRELAMERPSGAAC